MLPLPHMAFARISQNHGAQGFAPAFARAWPRFRQIRFPFPSHSPPSFCLIFPEADRCREEREAKLIEIGASFRFRRPKAERICILYKPTNL